MIQTNWYVITGGPGSGKTTTINLLGGRGYKTTVEHARHYIDTQHQKGRTIEEIRKNQEEFQLRVVMMQIKQEAQLSPEQVVFLDRALPDALAYYRFLKLPVHPILTEALALYHYKKVFVLDLLPLVQDYARREDEKAQQAIHALLIEVYTSLKCTVMQVPALLPGARVDYILKNL